MKHLGVKDDTYINIGQKVDDKNNQFLSWRSSKNIKIQ